MPGVHALTKPALAYETPVHIPARNPASKFARYGTPGRKAPRPLAYEVREGKPLLDLEPGDCRWPVGEPGAGTFCGCKAVVGRLPYCAEHVEAHTLKAFTPGEVDSFVKMALRIDAATRRVR